MGCQASLIVQADTPRKKLSRNQFTQHSVISNKYKRSSVMNEFQLDNKQQQSDNLINDQGQPKLMNKIKVDGNEHQQSENKINKKSVTSLSQQSQQPQNSQQQQTSQTLHHSYQSQSTHSNSHQQASSCQQQQSFRQITMTINKLSQSNIQKYNKRSSTQRNLHFDFTFQDGDQMKQNICGDNVNVNNLDVSNNNSSSKYVTNSNSSLSVSLAQFNSYRMISYNMMI